MNLLDLFIEIEEGNYINLLHIVTFNWEPGMKVCTLSMLDGETISVSANTMECIKHALKSIKIPILNKEEHNG